MRYALTLVAALVVCLAALTSSQAGPIKGAETTEWFNGSIAVDGDGAAITSAVTGKRMVLLGFTLQSDTAGVVRFTDGAGGDTIGAVYLAANTNLTVDRDSLGEGIKSTAGNAIYADLASATLTGILRIKQE